jgi:hypothetical protein
MPRTHRKNNRTAAKEANVNVKRAKTPLIDGLSHPRPGSHWKNLKTGQEVVTLPSKYDAKVYFYDISGPTVSWLPVDLFYRNFSFIRQAHKDEDFMIPVALV